MRIITNILFLLFFSLSLLGQNGALIIENNANIILTNNINVIVLQSSNQGIQKTGNLQGGIISNHEQSRIIWRVSTSTGNYTIPFKIGNTQIPFLINKTTSGVGVGKYLVSTYHTVTNNTPYPNGYTYFSPVTNMNYNGVENSTNAVDRFWIINYTDYTTIPSSQFTMTYDAVNDLNGIIESELQAQYWNGSQWILPPTGVANPVNDNVNSIPSVNQNAPWVLSNKNLPLIVHGFNIFAECDIDKIKIIFYTQSEINVDYFKLYASYDAVNYYFIDNIIAEGSTTFSQTYTVYDNISDINSTIYYKVLEYDYDGSSYELEPVISINCQINNINIYPNPVNKDENIIIDGDIYNVKIFNSIGQEINCKIIDNKIKGLPSGIYFVIINNIITKKLIIK